MNGQRQRDSGSARVEFAKVRLEEDRERRYDDRESPKNQTERGCRDTHPTVEKRGFPSHDHPKSYMNLTRASGLQPARGHLSGISKEPVTRLRCCTQIPGVKSAYRPRQSLET